MKFRLWPGGLIGQLILAVAVTLFVAQAINLALLARGQRQQQLAHGGGMAAARLIDAIDREERGVLVPQMRPMQRDHMGRRARAMVSDTPFPVPPHAVPAPDLANYVAELLFESEVPATNVAALRLPARASRRDPNIATQTIIVTAEVNGRFFAVRGRTAAGGGRLQGFLVWQTLTLYLLLLVPILIIAWRAAVPLRALTRAARADPVTPDAEPLLERGPSDVRDLISAFNAYRSRIVTMLSDKDRMLGAVGHDLRTPLASLRVRVEQVDDERLREKMIASIDEMTAMLTDILALARRGAGTEAAESYDPGQLLAEIGQDYRSMNRAVAGPDVGHNLPRLHGRSMLVRRALRNLIDNALTYGGGAKLSTAIDDGGVRLIVRDEGPGIDPARLTDLIEPFARGETSRNRATGGAGLGLAIARDIAEGEGGRLEIANLSDKGGLEAALILPIVQQ